MIVLHDDSLGSLSIMSTSAIFGLLLFDDTFMPLTPLPTLPPPVLLLLVDELTFVLIDSSSSSDDVDDG